MQRKKQNLKQFRNILKLQKRTQINCIPSNQSNIIRKKKNPSQIALMESCNLQIFKVFEAHKKVNHKKRSTYEQIDYMVWINHYLCSNLIENEKWLTNIVKTVKKIPKRFYKVDLTMKNMNPPKIWSLK